MKLHRGFATIPGNYPRALPGAYRYVHAATNKCYVGISRSIAKRQHHEGLKNKFSNALRKYGRSAFRLEPLFYWTDGDFCDPEKVEQNRQWLGSLEQTLIAEFDAVKSGYNTNAAGGGVGPYGPIFRQTLNAAWAARSSENRKEHALRSAATYKATTTPEQRSENGRKGGFIGGPKAGKVSALARTRNSVASIVGSAQ